MASEFDIFQAAARVYADSLLQLAGAAGQEEAIQHELSDLRALWRQDRSFEAFMRSAAIDEDARRDSLRKIFTGRVHPLVLNLLLVLNDHRRAMIFPLVCDAYHREYDKQRGRQDVWVTSAIPLEERHRKAITSEIARLTGKQAILREQVDADVLGGVRVQAGDRVWDMSVRRRLRQVRTQLLRSVEQHVRSGSTRFVTEG